MYWDAVPPETGGETPVLSIRSASFVLGIGCKKGTDPDLLKQSAEEFLHREGISRTQLKALASCTLKEQESAILALAEQWGVPFQVFTPSDAVFEKTGTHSVSEASAILASGGKISTPKPFAAGTSRWPWQRARMAAGTRPVKEPEMSSSSGWGPGLRASLRRKRRQPWSNAPA